MDGVLREELKRKREIQEDEGKEGYPIEPQVFSSHFYNM